jgi:hypothetical protein
MPFASPEAETLTMKQRIFIGVLGVLSVLLAALVVFYFSPAGETSEALPGQHLSPTVYEDQSVAIQESIGNPTQDTQMQICASLMRWKVFTASVSVIEK